jgi:ABC-type uncharacterized transport system fused permease/ATPase subunit
VERYSYILLNLNKIQSLTQLKYFGDILWKGIHMFNFRWSVKDIFIKGLHMWSVLIFFYKKIIYEHDRQTVGLQPGIARLIF